MSRRGLEDLQPKMLDEDDWSREKPEIIYRPWQQAGSKAKKR